MFVFLAALSESDPRGSLHVIFLFNFDDIVQERHNSIASAHYNYVFLAQAIDL